MNNNQKNHVILCEEDFRMLKQFAENFSGTNVNEMSLSYELNRAVVVDNDELPAKSIRLNSQVKVKELVSNKVMEFSIVMPAYADIGQKKISVLTPMGAALIGLCEGETVEWKMPAGLKKFKVLDVTQSAE